LSFLLVGKVWQSKLRGTEKLVGLVLADLTSDDGIDVHVPLNAVAEKCGLSVSTVRRIVGRLKAKGFLVSNGTSRGLKSWRVVLP
jgi:DNA-binding IscR family transcriptional regulator